MKKKLKLGLFGFGCVGQGLYHVLHETHGIKAEIKKICVKNKTKSRPIDESFFTYQKEEILNDPEIDVVVELIDDANAAFEIVKTSLEHGKAVVTANKKMLAEHLEEIYQLQKKHNRPVLYEGSVCGSIPILRNLEEYYDNDLLQSIEGIFNGSTNYILTKVFEEGKNYNDALKQAQELGFAESDPSLDVKAFDPKYKLTIAILHTFGVFVNPEDVINIGIDKISDADLNYAKVNGYTIKLLAQAHRIGGKVYGFVAPQYIESTNPLASVRNEFNAVQLQGAFAEKQLFIGKGAGSYPTGSAVLSDISALTYDYQYEYKKIFQERQVAFSNEASANVIVSFQGTGTVTAQDFEQFEEVSENNGFSFLKGTLTLEKLRELSANPEVSIILSPENKITPLKAVQEKSLVYA